MSIFDVDIHKKQVSNNLKKRHCEESNRAVDNYCYFRLGYTHLMLRTVLRN